VTVLGRTLNEHPFIVVRRGKGGKHREVTIGPRFRAELKRFLRAKESWGEPLGAASPVFVSERGRFSGSGIARVFRRACVAAGLPPFNAHKARHFYGTQIFAATKDLRIVRKMLGHARITTTQTYMQLHDDEAADGLAAFEKYIAAPPAGAVRPRAAARRSTPVEIEVNRAEQENQTSLLDRRTSPGTTPRHAGRRAAAEVARRRRLPGLAAPADGKAETEAPKGVTEPGAAEQETAGIGFLTATAV
jgi:hypothetical protein